MSEAGEANALRASSNRPKAGASVGRNFVAMMAWQIGNYLVPLATFPYLTRVLGPSQFGMLGFAMAIAMYGSIFTEWGFNLSGPRATVQCRGKLEELNRLIWSTMAAKACLCLLSLAALLIALRFNLLLTAVGPVVLWSWLMVFGNVITLNWLFQGLERFSVFATVSLLGRVLTLPFTFIFVKSADDVSMAAAIQAAAAVLTGLMSLMLARKLGVLGRPSATWKAIVDRLRQGVHMFVATASVSLFSTTNTVILASLTGTYQVGIYAAADKLKTVGNMVPAQINTVLYPRIAALFLDRRSAAARLTAIGGLLTFLTSVAGIAVFALLAKPLTHLVLGAGYAGAATVLQVLALATLFGNLAYFLGLQVFVPFGMERKRSHFMLAGGCLNVLLACVLIPRFGALGAAEAFLAAEIAILCAITIVIVRTPRLRQHFAQLARR